ncbi:hypothetical protein F3Y22_tig00112225pilonHSYRG00078 [Hibiscus syriacus]|uniref:Uncharacterized protein n=1 Tax=Hibiscus syriacus TaxID=106335 RepID=A0A6A2Y856_HIBSY|nr:hypothetical protein F3Y22_tig00112225pilonHSYRG00078 [Hibiscus syriacus]
MRLSETSSRWLPELLAKGTLYSSPEQGFQLLPMQIQVEKLRQNPHRRTHVLRANESYNKLIGRLLELFVAKAERLKALIKILCSAAKKMHEGEEAALGAVEEAEVHASQVVGVVRKKDAGCGGAVAGGIFRPTTNSQGFDAYV